MKRLLWLLLLPATVGLGCGGQTPTAPVVNVYLQPVPDPPPVGQVRIAAEKMQETGDIIKWQWIIVRKTAWTELETDGQEFSLKGSRELRANELPDARHLILEFAMEDASLRGTARFGAVATKTRFAAGLTSLSKEWPAKNLALKDLVDVKLKEEQVLPMPAEITLAVLRHAQPDGNMVERVYKIRIAAE